MQTASKILKAARQASGLSQSKFALLLGDDVTRSRIANYETERTDIPGTLLLKAMEMLEKKKPRKRAAA